MTDEAQRFVANGHCPRRIATVKPGSLQHIAPYTKPNRRFWSRPMPLSRANIHLLTVALALAAAAACAAIFSPGAFAGDRSEAKDTVQQPTTITAKVVHADGSPVEGAVVVTSAGGQGVSQRDGAARITVDLDPTFERDAMFVTAFAVIDGVNHVGSVEVELATRRHDADAGVIVLSAEGECEPAWIPTFDDAGGMNNSISALTVFDDGSGVGPALYAGGGFTTAGGVSANHIAKWDGESWSPLGSGTTDRVRALTVFDDGSGPALYAGGDFTWADGVTVRRIAKWDGESWSPLGDGIPFGGWLSVLTVFDDGSGPALYAGGEFTMIGGVEANRIAKWDGASWSPLGSGVSGGSVRALTVFDDGSGAGPALYAAGAFITAGGVTANRIAKWDGASWSPLGSGTTAAVRDLAVFDDGAGPALYACGEFTMAGGLSASRIAKWDGAEWTSLGNGLLGPSPNTTSVHTLTVFDDGSGFGPALYAGGIFTGAGGVSANSIAKWDGESWSPLGSGMGGATFPAVNTLAVFDDGSGAGPFLYAGGNFTTAGGVAANYIAKWDGVAWPSTSSRLNNSVWDLTVFDDGSGGGPALYVAGTFTAAGGVLSSRVAKWDGELWSPLGSGTNLAIRALAVFDDGAGPALYAGGSFTFAGGVPASRIAKWDGESWMPLGSGMNNSVSALTVFDDGSGPALYAGGVFTTAGGVTVNRIARWDGAEWSHLGVGMNDSVNALTVYNDGSGAGPALYAGGSFTTAGGVTVNRIARWDGAEWSPLGSGISGNWVNALTVFTDGSGSGPALYVGGRFTSAGGVSVNRIAKWNGASWSPLDSGLGGGSVPFVAALAVYNDGSGARPALYAAGRFAEAGGVPAGRIAKWDGVSWSSLGSGWGGGQLVGIYALAVFDDGSGAEPALYVGGDFTSSPSLGRDPYLAKLQGCPLPCPFDLLGDGSVGKPDLAILLGSWGPCPAPPNACIADLDGDGFVGSADLAILMGSWGPCP